MELTKPNTATNRKITMALLRNFAGIEAEFVTENAVTKIRLTTNSEATWSGACAAFEEELCTALFTAFTVEP